MFNRFFETLFIQLMANVYVYSGYSLQYTLLCAASFVPVYTTKSSAFTAKIILGTDFEV